MPKSKATFYCEGGQSSTVMSYTYNRFLSSQKTPKLPQFLNSSIYPHHQFPFETISWHLISTILYQLAPWQSLSSSFSLFVCTPGNLRAKSTPCQHQPDAVALQRAVAAQRWLHGGGCTAVAFLGIRSSSQWWQAVEDPLNPTCFPTSLAHSSWIQSHLGW